jgi:hypothetical protein
MVRRLLRSSLAPLLLLVACSEDEPPTAPQTPGRAGFTSGPEADAQSLPTYLVGAYYFSGWWRYDHPVLGLDYFPGHYIHDYPDSPVDWREDYPEREPVTGWFDDQQALVDKQIPIAAEGGLDFFVFEYFTDRADAAQFPGSQLNNNNGLKYFRTSPYRGLMRYALLYVNNGRFAITADEPQKWYQEIQKWVQFFKDDEYLKIDNKPVFIVINAPGMGTQWAGEESSIMERRDSVRARLAELRDSAAAGGFPGVLIGAGVTRPNPGLITRLSEHGYDFFTSFNAGFGDENSAEREGCPPLQPPQPGAGSKYADLIQKDYMTCRWNLFRDAEPPPGSEKPLPYAPVVVQGFDRRPVGKAGGTSTEPYLVKKTPELFAKQLTLAKAFVDNPGMRLPSSSAGGQRMVVIYAWNELGEGGHLIPVKGEGEKSVYLNKVREVFP